MAGPKNNKSLAKSNRPSNQPAKPSQTHVSINATHTHSETTIYEGMLPPPHLLREFDELIPDGANRYMNLVEKQAAHRQELEKKVVNAGIVRERIGQACAFLIGSGGLGSGTYLIINGHDAAGATLVGGTLVSLVSAFITGTRSQRKEREEKAKNEKEEEEEKPPG